jgi:hypothetical protein
VRLDDNAQRQLRCRFALAAGIGELFLPIAATPLGNQIEDVPERFDGADVTWILARVCGRVEHFRAPKVPDDGAFAMKHVQHRLLVTGVGLATIVAVEAVFCRGKQAKVAPASLLSEGQKRGSGALATMTMFTRGSTCGAVPSS